MNVLHVLLASPLNHLRPKSDQYKFSPHNVNTLALYYEI